MHAALERFRGLDTRGDVGEGRHDAAARHAVGAHLDHQAAVGKAFEKGLAAHVAGDALLDQRLGLARPEGALVGVVAQDLFEPDADADHLGGQAEHLAELPVPAHEMHRLVEHRDALAHVIERGLQDLAVVVQRRARIVEHLERGLVGAAMRRAPQRGDAGGDAGKRVGAR